MKQKIPCVRCGREIIAVVPNAKYCPECRNIAHAEADRKRREKIKKAILTGEYKPKPKKPEPPVKRNDLALLARSAAKKHTTYGKLTAPAVTVVIPPQFRTTGEG